MGFPNRNEKEQIFFHGFSNVLASLPNSTNLECFYQQKARDIINACIELCLCLKNHHPLAESWAYKHSDQI